MVVDIGDRSLNASFGLDSPEVAARMPDMPGADRAGYLLRVDTSGWESGTRHVKIATYDHDQNVATIVGDIAIRPFEVVKPTVEEAGARVAAGKVAMCLDSPSVPGADEAVDVPVRVHGWAHAPQGIEAVVITVDGRYQHEALRPVCRPDLLNQYGRDVSLDAGFTSLLLDEECGPGRHTVTIVALGKEGNAVGTTRELLCGAESTASSDSRIERQGDLAKPKLRDKKRAPEAETALEDRVFLAEASAAQSRAEARLVHEHQRSFGRAWRQLETKAQNYDAVRRELDQRQADLSQATAEADELRDALAAMKVQRELLDQRTTELEEARRFLRGAEELLEKRIADLGEANAELVATRQELERHAVLVEEIENSTSWRVTRPLRAARGLFRRDRKSRAKMPPRQNE